MEYEKPKTVTFFSSIFSGDLPVVIVLLQAGAKGMRQRWTYGTEQSDRSGALAGWGGDSSQGGTGISAFGRRR